MQLAQHWWDILMLDIVRVIVVLAIGVNAEIRMFQSVSVSQMAVSSRDEYMKLVCHVQWIADKIG
jgi:hypothetical protein